MPDGSRFTDGGYQAPSTNATAIKRGQPLRRWRGQLGTTQIELAVIPLEGGRPDFFEVMLLTDDPVRKRTTYIPCMLAGRDLAGVAFELTAAELDAGRLPDAVLLPAGARVGW
jgi:hypothetical protein